MADSQEDVKTKEVETLLGNPKKAVVAMAIPMAIAMAAQMANNLIDAVWVSGLGPNALAAVGLIFPLFFILVSVGNGIGIGASSAIARRIGRGDKAGAEGVVSQSVMLMLLSGVVMTVVFMLIAAPLLELLGAGEILSMTLDYGYPIFMCALVVFFTGLLTNLLRSEGAAKRSMRITILAAAVNIVLDPIFIYTFGWGMAGAAWATVIAMCIPLMVAAYWYLVKKDTYLRIRLRGFRFDFVTVKEIFTIGIPASVDMILISLVSMVMNVLLIMVDSTNGVAIFSSGWRLIQLLMIPLMAIGSAIVPVFAVGYGSRRYDKVRDAYVFSLKWSAGIMLLLSVLTFVFAPEMVTIFTYTESTAVLKDQMVNFLRISCLFLPFMSWGFVSGGLFQAFGMGGKALISSLFRNLLQIPVCYFLAITVSTLNAMWWGVATAEILGSIMMGGWGTLVLLSVLGKRRPRDPMPQ
ncbi:MAG: MATE family efflux transporter [Candidatus Methanomethylophilaceae archaeon]|mgnify:FL=1|jgi:putative MATE family efflux protein|nr:MATE family efflux transporter [Candidatus Methanomethylophilaceae archaeon]